MASTEQVTGNGGLQNEEGPETFGDDGSTPSTAEGVAGVDDVQDGRGDDDLAGVRDLILKAYPEIVPELLAGESVDALLASVPAARDAYRRVAESIQEQTPAPIPTGSGRRPAFDPEGLSPEGKIRAGLSQHSL